MSGGLSPRPETTGVRSTDPRDAVFSILSIMDGGGALAEIQIFDAQAHRFDDAGGRCHT